MPVPATKHKKTHWVCATAQNADLDQTGFEALTWVQVKWCRSEGDFGVNTNFSREPVFDLDVDPVFKNNSAGTDYTLECISVVDDAGQTILQTFADSSVKDSMAIKVIYSDADTGETATVRYSRGKVGSRMVPGGSPGDAEPESYVVALEQEPVVVKAA